METEDKFKKATVQRRKKSPKNHRRVALILAVVLWLLGVGTALYANDYYHATPDALDALASAQKLVNGYYVFGQENAQKGLIFYPGGKVDAAAYAPLLQSLAERGFLCILTSMPLRLAVLNINAADGLAALYPNVKDWYIGGHSLGGAMAAVYAAGHSADFQGLILLAAYSTADICASGLRVLTLYGSQDKVLNKEQFEKYTDHLPQGAKTIPIEGGCHAYFGNYGEQAGDGKPAITRAEQQQKTTDAILAFALNP